MGHKTSICITVTLLSILMTMFPINGFSEVPNQINFQGHLTDGLSNPLDGDYFMVFSIYDLSTGGAALWWEEQTVSVTNGIYNVRIGQNPTVNPFPDDLFDGNRWLGVTVETDAEMAPRQLLTSTPFSMRAAVADMVANDAVNTVHLMNDAVTGAKIDNGTVAKEDLQDGTALSEILDDDGSDSGLDADLLDGYSSADFALATEDFGRSGVSTTLYEGTQTLSSRYINAAGPDTVLGVSDSAMLQALNEGNGAGLRGSSQNHHGTIGYTDAANMGGVYGNSTDGYGVWGNSVNSHAVFGQSADGRGVKGVSPAGGVYGESTQGIGVEGKSNTNDGIVGVTLAGDKSGVYGSSDVGNGVTGRSAGASGVLGVTTSSDPGDAGVTARNEGGDIAIRAEGDLMVTGGAFRGDISPGGGAPFPRPAWDSGWVPINPGQNIVLPHTVGGNLDDYVVDFQQKDVIPDYSQPLIGIHNYGIGTRSGLYHHGAYFHDLKTYEVSIERYEDDYLTDQVRIRIWVVR